MVRLDPDRRVSRAAGSFSEALLTTKEDHLIEDPAVEYLDPSEHLEYILWHRSKGLRIIHPDGEEETPHHLPGTSGSRFLLITDKRLCYLAGLDSQDEQRTFDYTELTDVEATSKLFSQWVTFTDHDGVQYRFADSGKHARDVQPAAEYIQTQVTNAKPSSSLSGTGQSGGTAYCDECGEDKPLKYASRGGTDLQLCKTCWAEQFGSQSRNQAQKSDKDDDTQSRTTQSASADSGDHTDYSGIRSSINYSALSEDDSDTNAASSTSASGDNTEKAHDDRTHTDDSATDGTGCDDCGVDEPLKYVRVGAKNLGLCDSCWNARFGSQSDDKEQGSTARNKTRSDNQSSDSRTEAINEKVDSIKSDLREIDSLVLDAEFQEASQRLEAVESDISELETDFDTAPTDPIETAIRELREDHTHRLSKSHILDLFRGMDPYDFEHLVANIWSKHGWDTQITSGSGDRGVDIVATKEDTFETRRHLIQVKRHGRNTKLGSEAIQRYAGLYQRDEQVDNVFVVTSNQFTDEAIEVAQQRGVSTINCDDLYELLTET